MSAELLSETVTSGSHSEAQLQRLLANYKLTPMTLAMKLNPRIIPTPYLNFISAKVASTIARGGGRLIISAPPRHGKSELITKNTPIWTLENYSYKNVILCTYGGELSTDFGRKVRDLVTENEHLLNIRLKADASRVNNWHTQSGGAMMSVGLGGPITGRGADVLLIDDYIKEIKESLSASHREYIWEWFVTTAFTRLEPGGSCIIIATRWHEDDLIGRILKHNPGGKWENIVIPALAEPAYWDGKPVPEDWTDFLGRKFGEPLFPERYPLDVLQERKEVLGSYFFNALFQQRPEDPNSKLTDKNWLKLVKEPPVQPGLKYARIWDLAATEDGGDWTAGILECYQPITDFMTILDVKREQLSPGQVEELVLKTAAADGPNVKVLIEQEPGSSGKSLVFNYQRMLKKIGIECEPVPATKNKVVRAQPFLSAVESGHVAMLEAPWNHKFAEEYDEFPAGEHDDQVDTAAAGYVYLSGKEHLTTTWGREIKKDYTEIDGVRVGSARVGEIILPTGQVYNYDPSVNHEGPVRKASGIIWGRRTKAKPY